MLFLFVVALWLLTGKHLAASGKTDVGICAVTRFTTNRSVLRETLLEKQLLSSLKATVLKRDRSLFSFSSYLAVDVNDQFRIAPHHNLSVPEWLRPHFQMHASPALNHISRTTYGHGEEYLVRSYEVPEFGSAGWVSRAVVVLTAYDPFKAGAEGANAGNTQSNITIYGMVHRTHWQIFGYYYPPVLASWCKDAWASKVYGPERSTRLSEGRLKGPVRTALAVGRGGEERFPPITNLEAGANILAAWLGKRAKHRTKLPVLISSLGGVGSSFFMHHLNSILDTNAGSDKDGFKHRNANWFQRENATLYGKTKKGVTVGFAKVLVIIGEPLHSILSVYRRFGVSHLNKWRRNINATLFSAGTKLEAIWKQTTAAQKDILGIESFLSSWSYFCQRNSDLCRLVTTKSLYDHSFEICEFLTTLSTSCSGFKAMKYNVKNRSSQQKMLADVPEEIIQMYSHLYQEYQN